MDGPKYRAVAEITQNHSETPMYAEVAISFVNLKYAVCAKDTDNLLLRKEPK